MNAHAPTVLVVEDDSQIRHFVSGALRREGFVVTEAGTAGGGLAIAAEGVDLVVLDLGLPDFGGLEFIRRLRDWSRIPILILSARSAEQDKIAALDAGADDYLAKPFGTGELIARTRALLRRAPRFDESQARVSFGEIEVDLAQRSVKRGGELLHLTDLEYRLLAVLLANDGKVMTHRNLMQEVWGPGHAQQAHYLRIYVARLRQKLERLPAQPEHFLTETGIGYRFQSTAER